MKKLIFFSLVIGLMLVALPGQVEAVGKVKNVRVSQITSNSALAKCNSVSGAYQYVYKVYQNTPKKAKKWKLVKTYKTSNTYATLRGLKKKKKHKVVVKAKDYYGNSGKRSKAKVFTTKSWRMYHSNKYGFSLQFPKSWKGYRVKVETGYDGTYVTFKLKSQVMNYWYGMFSILVYDISQADDLYYYYGTPLAQNDDYVFYWMHAQDTASDLYDEIQDIYTIVGSIEADRYMD